MGTPAADFRIDGSARRAGVFDLDRGTAGRLVHEFDAQISPDSTLKVPGAFAAQIEADQPVHVVLLVPELGEDQDWSRLTAERFLKAYADNDAIYDNLPSGSIEKNKLVRP